MDIKKINNEIKTAFPDFQVESGVGYNGTNEIFSNVMTLQLQSRFEVTDTSTELDIVKNIISQVKQKLELMVLDQEAKVAEKK